MHRSAYVFACSVSFGKRKGRSALSFRLSLCLCSTDEFVFLVGNSLYYGGGWMLQLLRCPFPAHG